MKSRAYLGPSHRGRGFPTELLRLTYLDDKVLATLHELVGFRPTDGGGLCCPSNRCRAYVKKGLLCTDPSYEHFVDVEPRCLHVEGKT